MSKTILATIVAFVAILTVMTFVSASAGGLTNDFDVTVDGIEYSAGDTIGIEAGETIPVKVIFTATENASDVKLKVWIDGYRSEIQDRTGEFELVDESTYSRTFSLTVPSDIEPTEDYKLIVRISDKTKSYEEEFDLKLQRESYKSEVLSVDAPDKATPGSTIAVDVVVKNRGMHELEDVFVKAKISDLGVERRVYFGDIDPQDECDYDDDCDGNREDAVDGRIYLTLPKNAKAGTYSLEVEVYNSDFTETAKKTLVVSGESETSEILSGVTSRAIAVGEEATYDLVIVNSGDEIKVYTLTPEDATGLIVEVDPIVTVAADSSETVEVTVKATDSAEEGTQTVAVNVESGGELVERAVFSVNVEKATRTASSVVVLTIVLAIVFIVLLIVLIVLLTGKKSSTSEVEEETSYY